MIETTVEVATSPATMSISVERILDLAVTVSPDPAHQGQWPATATRYTISITYDDGPVHSYDGQLDPITQQGPIAHIFTGLPSGGNITVLACFYAATGWLAGQGDRPLSRRSRTRTAPWRYRHSRSRRTWSRCRLPRPTR